MEDHIYLARSQDCGIERARYVVRDQPEAFMLQQVLDIGKAAGQKVIDSRNLVPLGK
jgi:hypothetical protein